MGLVKSVKNVISEILTDRKRIVRLAVYDVKNKNGEGALGFIGSILSIAVRALVYWLVFSVGMNLGGEVGGVSYVLWLIVGVVPWYFMSECISDADKSVSKLSSVTKGASLPLASIPVKTVISDFIIHFISLIIAFIIVATGGVHIGNQLWQVVYYMFAAVVFLVSYSLVGSSLSLIFKSYHKTVSFAVKMMFFVSPVVWTPDESHTAFRVIMMINPFAYIINGYRNSMFYSESLLSSYKNGLIFWAITVVMLIVGCLLHSKLRRKFAELI